MNQLEIWLNKWRLQIAAKKCSFTVYSKGQIPKKLKENKIKLYLNNEEITIDHKPLYLGIQFDRNLMFKKHIENTYIKTSKMLNVLKCLSYKTWSLKTEQQLMYTKV